MQRSAAALGFSFRSAADSGPMAGFLPVIACRSSGGAILISLGMTPFLEEILQLRNIANHVVHAALPMLSDLRKLFRQV